jgi:hypothetical protein
MEREMKKLLLIGAITVMSSAALAQPSQSQGGAQAGTNGTADTTNAGAMSNPSRASDMTNGTTSGTNTGNAAHPVETTGPSGQMSKPATTK